MPVSNTPLYDCGKENETVEHLLLRCSNHEEARRVMMDYMEDTGIMFKQKGSNCITESLLLAPP